MFKLCLPSSPRGARVVYTVRLADDSHSSFSLAHITHPEDHSVRSIFLPSTQWCNSRTCTCSLPIGITQTCLYRHWAGFGALPCFPDSQPIATICCCYGFLGSSCKQFGKISQHGVATARQWLRDAAGAATPQWMHPTPYIHVAHMSKSFRVTTVAPAGWQDEEQAANHLGHAASCTVT